jgi:tRNA (guanine10-N2)-methyltransferase
VGTSSEFFFHSLETLFIWSQKLVTMKKTTVKEYPMPTFDRSEGEGEDQQHAPAHQNFREKYFQGFKAGADAPPTPAIVKSR